MRFKHGIGKYLQGRDYTRELVRMRDNYMCQKCGHIWIEGERRLDVHHRDCDKEKTMKYDRPEEMKNMITLCHKCHMNIPAHRRSMKIGWLKIKSLYTDYPQLAA